MGGVCACFGVKIIKIILFSPWLVVSLWAIVKIKKRRYVQFVLALLAIVIIAGTVLVNSPRVQQRVSVLLATELENRIGTRVGLGGVRWLFPSDIVVDSLTIDDQEGEQLLSVSRLAAKVEWMPLILERRLSIRNVRLFHPDIHLYRADAADDYNYQFLLDAFAAKKEKKKEPSRLSLRINTLLIRHAHVCHRVGDVVTEGTPKFDPKNLAIDDLSAQFSLKTLSADSVSFIVRHLSMKEHSGLHVDNLYLRLVANRYGATLANFQLDLPHSSLRLDTVWASFPMRNKHSVEAEPLNPFVLKGKILPSYVTPSDLTPLLSGVAGIDEKVHLDADFIGSPSRINLKALNVYTAHRDLALSADAKLAIANKHCDAATLALHEATVTEKAWTLLAKQAPAVYKQLPQELVHIGNMTATGALSYSPDQTNLDVQAITDAGNVALFVELDGKGRYAATLKGDTIEVARVIPGSVLAQTNLDLQLRGAIKDPKILDFKNLPSLESLQKSLSGTIAAVATHTHVLGYEYDSIRLDVNYAPWNYQATLKLDDSNGALALDFGYQKEQRIPRYTAAFRADSLNLHAMNLIGIHEDATFSMRLMADLRGRDLDHLMGKIVADSFAMHRPTGDYVINEVALYASDPGSKMLSFKSDFMDATLRGEFAYRSLANSLFGHLHHSLPSLCHSHDHNHKLSDNICLVNVGIYNTDPLRELLFIPVDVVGKAQFDLLINDPAGELSFTASVPQVNYEENTLKGISVDCNSKEQGLGLSLVGTLQNEGVPAITALLATKAADDKVDLGLLWNSNPAGVFDGVFHTRAAFTLDSDDNLCVSIEADSTQTTINHSVWELEPFAMNIAPGHILIDGLHFANDTVQHLSVDGVISGAETDTLQVNFTALDLGYLLSLVKLEGISFDGDVSGRAELANLYSDHPYVDANIGAKGFAFCEGPMGDLDGHIYWDQDDAQLQFVADVWETPEHTSVVDGVVDFNKKELWIDIAADSLNTAFLNRLLKSFMNEVKGNASGHLTVGGPLNAINLDGALLADVGFNLIPTDVEYHFKDSLRFTPGVIRFDGIEAFDHRGQKAIVVGAVTHRALKDFAYDLYIDAQNALGIDLPDTGHDSFYTTIYGTGGVQVKGSPTMPLTIDIQAQPEKGSVFALNLASQNVSSSDAFITFTDRSSTRNVPTVATRKPGRRRRAGTRANASTNIDIMAHVTPDATLKLVMNQAVDDHISVTGRGDLQVNVRGDDISLFGTYTVNRGFYRLSLQDVINKNFDVISGSTVAFEGDPLAARLDITARHAVNYVPLRDLSPDMTGNVHVNCLLRIGGTLNAPTVTFDLELVNATEEEKSILDSYTNTAEQMNLQFIYLLGLGKFYTPDMAQNTQGTTNNMESFISSTISGQINNLLAGIISNENWNLASNLRAENMMTGVSDLGGDNWDNMEIEGILEGRLLDNRLLINGSFGYRENPMYATNFIGDFDIRYLLTGGLSLKGYNKTNDRYFTKTALTTQGLGLVFQHDFDRLLPRRKRKQSAVEQNDSVAEVSAPDALPEK